MQEARIFLIALPGVLLALWALYGVWRQGGELLAAERERSVTAPPRGCWPRRRGWPPPPRSRCRRCAPTPASTRVSTNRGEQRRRPTRPANYLRLYSQSTDPAGLTGYAIKKQLEPAVPAATGANVTLAVALGGYKNQNTTTITRVFTLQALSPLPAGRLAADGHRRRSPPTRHRQASRSPRSASATLDGSGAGPTATLDRRRQAPGQPHASGRSRTASSRATTCCTRRR